ncbi:MAG: hypothetical protein LC750_07560 [Actinobacteria bacterium]|nr:hypothetical protein [Actinomycetota bacterium]
MTCPHCGIDRQEVVKTLALMLGLIDDFANGHAVTDARWPQMFHAIGQVFGQVFGD